MHTEAIFEYGKINNKYAGDFRFISDNNDKKILLPGSTGDCKSFSNERKPDVGIVARERCLK